MRKDNLIGVIFGKGTVVSQAETRVSSGRKRVIWKLECECGNFYEAAADKLKNGHNKSCGCSRGVKSVPLELQYYNLYAYSSDKRDYEFSLTYDEFVSIINKPCHYCNTEKGSSHRSLKCSGVDRVDNSKGYTTDNVVPCCTICNRMKLALTEEVFMAHITKIYNHSGGGKWDK